MMFSDKPWLSWENELGKFRLTREFAVKWHERRFVVHEGFLTDLASIPRLFQSAVPKVGRHIQPAIAHDWLYQHGVAWTRTDADQMFLDGMETMGVAWMRRRVMYRAVRLGGGHLWRPKKGSN